MSAEDRVRKGITVSKRMRWAPLPLQTKSQLDCVFGWTGRHVWFPVAVQLWLQNGRKQVPDVATGEAWNPQHALTS